MRIVRLYDPNREPQNWLQIIRPTEFAAFATLVDSGSVCDADGVVTSPEDASCLIFTSLSEAEAFCRERVAQLPSVRFEILDAGGRLRPPLLTIVHPSRVDALDGSPRKMRWNRRAATVALIGGPLLIWFDWMFYGGNMILPTIVGINGVLIGVRLLVMNRGHIAAERARSERVTQALAGQRHSDPSARPTST
jgi:hypothetical protein